MRLEHLLSGETIILLSSMRNLELRQVSLLVLTSLFFKILEIEEAGQKSPLFTNYSPIAQLVRAPH